MFARDVKASAGCGNADIWLPGKGNSNSHGARPVPIKWIWTSSCQERTLSLVVARDENARVSSVWSYGNFAKAVEDAILASPERKKKHIGFERAASFFAKKWPRRFFPSEFLSFLLRRNEIVSFLLTLSRSLWAHFFGWPGILPARTVWRAFNANPACQLANSRSRRVRQS